MSKNTFTKNKLTGKDILTLEKLNEAIKIIESDNKSNFDFLGRDYYGIKLLNNNKKLLTNFIGTN